MEFKQNCIVLYASPYNFTDEKTGEIRTGTTIQYIMSDHLTPVSDKDSKGQRIGKCSFPREHYAKIVEAPGLYELTISARANGMGQMKLVPVDLKFISSIEKVK